MNESQDFVGKRVQQVRAATAECQKFVGRVGVVEEAFTDEKGQVHCKTTEDGVWCPAAFLAVV